LYKLILQSEIVFNHLFWQNEAKMLNVFNRTGTGNQGNEELEPVRSDERRPPVSYTPVRRGGRTQPLPARATLEPARSAALADQLRTGLASLTSRQTPPQPGPIGSWVAWWAETGIEPGRVANTLWKKSRGSNGHALPETVESIKMPPAFPAEKDG
jgi:hypothetical protein